MGIRRWCEDLFLFEKPKTRRSTTLQSFLTISWYDRPDLNQYLQSFSKSPKPNDELRQKGFRLRVSSGYGKDILSPGPYRDAEYTIALYNNALTKEVPEKSDYLACIGFDIDGNRVIVKQIQGNPGKGEILCLFKWERMLLAILIDWAKQSSFDQIRVIRAQDQSWYRTDSERAKRMFMHYDVTARRSGFDFDPNSGEYTKVLA
ncbi:MAG: hypothetical protein A2655_01435 [Candidatus Yanofskybacteria bacterium RIFCSPHIGHO2_01_FULL_43_42]|uniref:Uncharacterized protein n=1 Tax=Candidatus Yanofskybacteria bacterium RIFCSPLOWO2_01_FULL_43_22 TaxID=1802695 RepID=A0A1F8GJG0_9BACT|nr:MAG: hypothetical protein A2655_01435 [Candidatus Yanofskybacteria bacterium RIFCSPHIGHO2_01_FULL_43_42]OGN13145.1 MAG: hypothetical protein A3D48_02345 [Candidatus Yanofskybacteria bacterium RIFCSPHIGHO2_02_FULL_43_17]OGN24559.1 MAG: hypothetical protein A3A13_00565 [Candidatus Yanofskybacteria bacterium RIFCSPLOWO2_01_FULL_43_22]